MKKNIHKEAKIIFLFLIFFYSISFSQENTDIIKDLEGKSAKLVNKVSGNIFMGNNLLSEGRIFLIRNSKSLLTTFGNSDVIGGSYMFENIDFDNFSLYVVPKQDYDFFYFPKYLPTYLGDVYNWEAATINENKKYSNHNYDIHLKKYSEPYYGHGKISGKITYDKSYSGTSAVPISILLLNSEKAPMDFRLADDDDGSFLFEHLPDGKYFIHPEKPGFITEDYEIIVKSKKTNRIDFRINDNSIKHEIEEETIKPIVLKNGLKFSVNNPNNEPIVCELTDLAGRLILKEKFLLNSIYINTSNINTGTYLLRARTFSNSIIKTSKVFINNN